MPTTYKFRAECERDCQLAFVILSYWVIAWTDEKLFFEDGRWSGEMESTFTLKDDSPGHDFLIWILDKAVDLHVATDTLEPVEQYTGERKYGKTISPEGKHPLFVQGLNAGWFRQNMRHYYRRELRTDISDFLKNLKSLHLTA